ncbi:SIR2 family protein [Mycolicibacterium brisbanense]
MATKTSLDDPFLPLAFSLYSNPGAYAVLAGAGISRGAGLPTAWDIVVDLIAQMVGDDVDIDADTASDWYEKRYGKPPTYSDVVHQLALTQTERQTLLRKYFENGDDSTEQIRPSVAHRAVARLMQTGTIHVVLTVNFDRLFEQALQELGIEPIVVATDADAQGLAPLHTLRNCVIHLHGDYLNARSMRNTAAELAGYPRHMKGLLRRVVTDYGLLVAGWSVQYDPALREAVAAHYPSRFTMGWVSPGLLSADALSLTESKKALVLHTTADDAFGHLADEVEAMRDRHARHPLTLDVAVGRIKRQLAGTRPAIAAHDMLVSEFARLRDIPALHRDRRMDSDNADYESSLNQIEEACRLPVGCSAALAYWGDATTDRWWLSEIERFGRIDIASGTVRLIHLPLVAATQLFYGAGVAAVAAERFDLLRKLFQLRVNRVGQTPQPAPEILTPATVVEDRYPQLYDAILTVVGDALGLDAQPVSEALQLFEVLRLTTQLVESEGYETRIRELATANNAIADAPNLEAQLEARTARRKVVDQLAEQSSAYYTHLFAAERQYEAERGRRWSSPVAERLADEIARQRDSHPVVAGLQLGVTGAYLAAQAVGVAVGRVAQQLEWQAIPVVGGIGSGVIPSEFWLDGRPTS